MTNTVRYAGFAAETTFGVKKTDATFHVDIASATLDSPNDTNIFFSGGLGRGVQKSRAGFYSPTGNIAYALDVDTAEDFFKWALGGFKDDSATFSKKHLYGNDNRILPSFTSFIGKDIFEHQFAGCVINSLQLEVADEFAQLTADIVSARDYKGAIKDPEDLLINPDYPLVFHDVTVEVNGLVNTKVKNLKLDIKNNVSADNGKRLGSRFPQQLPAAARETTASFDLEFTDLSMLEAFWGSASGVSASATSETIALSFILTAPNGKKLTINLPNCMLTAVNQQATGIEEITQKVTVRALYDTVVLAGSSTSVKTEIAVTVE